MINIIRMSNLFLNILDIISYTQNDNNDQFYFNGSILGHTIKSLSELLLPPLSNDIIFIINNIIYNFVDLSWQKIQSWQLEIILESDKINDVMRLYLHHNEIKYIPDLIWKLKNLRFLYLQYNKIVNISDSIRNLDNLRAYI